MSTPLFDQLQSSLSKRYTLDRELGGGGMSRVFVADETRLGRKVVVKVMSADVAAGISAERFEREMRLAASLQQANIVPVLSAGEIDGVPYYTMPFVEGESLRARLGHGGPLPIGETIGILRDVARALAYAHEHGVVHRDIKPDNVLLSGGTAVVTDFGIAKALAASKLKGPADEAPAGTALTMVGTSIGTPAYMAPEQAAADPNVDHRADLYSFGCMAYELLAGETPFAGRPPQRMMAAHMVETPRRIEEIRPDTPLALGDLVMRCLEKEPAARPAGAAEVLQVLEGAGTGAFAPTAGIVIRGSRGLLTVLAIYAAAFIAVVILARAAIVGIGLPEWVFPGSLIVMGLGLPVILFTGLVHHLTKQAATRTPVLTPGGTPATHGTMASLAIKASPHVSWRRTLLGGAWAVGAFVLLVGGFMALRALGIGPAGSLFAAGTMSERDRLIVTDFRSPDSSLAHVLAEAVRTTLGESRVVSIMPPAAIAAALQRMRRPATTTIDVPLARELAQREGAKAIVDGDVTAIAGGAGGYVLSIRLITADSGAERAAFRESVKEPSELLEAVDEIARKLRGKIGESLRTVNAAPSLEQVTTASFPALLKYAAGARAVDIEGNPIKGAEILREAVKLDTTFAMAYRKLGVALNNSGRPRAEIDSALGRAYQYRDRLTERERLLATATYFHLGPGRDRNKAIAAYRAMLAFDPGETAASNNLANIYGGRRDFAQAESLYKSAIASGRAAGQNYTNLFVALFNQGKFDEAESVVELVRQRFPGSPGPTLARPVFLYARNQLDSLESEYRSMMTSDNPVIRINGVGGLASYSLLRGRLGDLRRFGAEASRLSRAFGAPENPVADSLQYSWLDVLMLDDTARAIRRMERSLARADLTALPFSNRPYVGLAAFYATVGMVDRARGWLARDDAEMPDSIHRRTTANYRIGALGAIALAERRYEEALRNAWRSDTTYDGPDGNCSFCVYAVVGRVHDQAGRPDSAIHYFEAYLKAPYFNRQGTDGLNRPLFHRRLGELYEQKGDTTNAARHYLAFVELWKNADPVLQPKVAEVRRRIARLADVEGGGAR